MTTADEAVSCPLAYGLVAAVRCYAEAATPAACVRSTIVYMFSIVQLTHSKSLTSRLSMRMVKDKSASQADGHHHHGSCDPFMSNNIRLLNILWPRRHGSPRFRSGHTHTLTDPQHHGPHIKTLWRTMCPWRSEHSPLQSSMVSSGFYGTSQPLSHHPRTNQACSSTARRSVSPSLYTTLLRPSDPDMNTHVPIRVDEARVNQADATEKASRVAVMGDTNKEAKPSRVLTVDVLAVISMDAETRSWGRTFRIDLTNCIQITACIEAPCMVLFAISHTDGHA
ncbi:hypothetical protein DOTSEDRAFT_75952 [Dothistroma septosporum NZE10]|uniref:Uncharacterized protein n=1 Tax=Dothistroma septosporum (strain NZE10 / CBS 128990) TaxID=675120 RepID=N1PDU2_DOTSN|nr:hypothetical protein DOTSEDRAFT_75952 [Dothistroma septosporum NZE10]